MAVTSTSLESFHDQVSVHSIPRSVAVILTGGAIEEKAPTNDVGLDGCPRMILPAEVEYRVV